MKKGDRVVDSEGFTGTVAAVHVKPPDVAVLLDGQPKTRTYKQLELQLIEDLRRPLDEDSNRDNKTDPDKTGEVPSVRGSASRRQR